MRSVIKELSEITAIDSLCGCKKGGDGKYTLKNFSIENSALEVTRVERKKYDA